MMMDFSAFLAFVQTRTEHTLSSYLKSDPSSSILQQAMAYSTLQGGKRIRPLLVYAVGDLFEAPWEPLDRCACAIEMIHAYSLIHDDLPAMDDDDLRRGLPTCHKVFGDAMAILAGDALQALAFEVLSHSEMGIESSIQLRLLFELAQACGLQGMAGGQALDIQATGQLVDGPAVETIHQQKTGALIQCAVKLAALVSGATASELAALNAYSRALGLAFQIQDDILDLETPTEILGKRQGADCLLDKATYPRSVGLDKAKETVNILYSQALEALAVLNQPIDLLRETSRYLVYRTF